VCPDTTAILQHLAACVRAECQNHHHIVRQFCQVPMYRVAVDEGSKLKCYKGVWRRVVLAAVLQPLISAAKRNLPAPKRQEGRLRYSPKGESAAGHWRGRARGRQSAPPRAATQNGLTRSGRLETNT